MGRMYTTCSGRPRLSRLVSWQCTPCASVWRNRESNSGPGSLRVRPYLPVETCLPPYATVVALTGTTGSLSGWEDLNLQLPESKSGRLPDCPTPRSTEGALGRLDLGPCAAYPPWESNPHSFRNRILNPARLPVPPEGRGVPLVRTVPHASA